MTHIASTIGQYLHNSHNIYIEKCRISGTHLNLEEVDETSGPVVVRVLLQLCDQLAKRKVV